MWLGRLHIASMWRGDKDGTMRVSSLSYKEPLIGVESGIDIMQEVVGKDCRDGGDSVIQKRENSLRRSGDWFGRKGTSGTEDGDICRRGSIDSHRGSEIVSSRGGDIDVVGVNSDIVMEWGEKEGVEHFLGYAGGWRRHGRRGEKTEIVSL